jgi:hypothetical protein
MNAAKGVATIGATTGTTDKIADKMKAVLAAISETASRTHVVTMGMTPRRSTADKSASPPEYFRLVNHSRIVINPSSVF